jgi:hypothetical protein
MNRKRQGWPQPGGLTMNKRKIMYRGKIMPSDTNCFNFKTKSDEWLVHDLAFSDDINWNFPKEDKALMRALKSINTTIDDVLIIRRREGLDSSDLPIICIYILKPENTND